MVGGTVGALVCNTVRVAEDADDGIAVGEVVGMAGGDKESGCAKHFSA